jgi:hypothetical protein
VQQLVLRASIQETRNGKWWPLMPWSWELAGSFQSNLFQLYYMWLHRAHLDLRRLGTNLSSQRGMAQVERLSSVPSISKGEKSVSGVDKRHQRSRAEKGSRDYLGSFNVWVKF